MVFAISILGACLFFDHYHHYLSMQKYSLLVQPDPSIAIINKRLSRAHLEFCSYLILCNQ